MTFSDAAKQQILHVLEKISQLSSMEKLLLYLRLPGGYPETGDIFCHFYKKKII